MTKRKTLISSHPSILGDLSTIHIGHSHKTGVPPIWDDPSKGYLYFTPTGISKYSNIQKCNRQDNHIKLYKAAVSMDVEKKDLPFPKSSCEIQLIIEKDNPYDSNAIRILLRLPKDSFLNSHWPPGSIIDLGFVPNAINKQIKKNIDMITYCHIYSIKKIYNNFWITYLRLSYGAHSNADSNPFLNKLSLIVGDLND